MSASQPPAVKTMRVSRTSDAGAVAGALASHLRMGAIVDLAACGPVAITVAAKAAATAAAFIANNGLFLLASPRFETGEHSVHDDRDLVVLVWTLHAVTIGSANHSLREVVLAAREREAARHSEGVADGE